MEKCRQLKEYAAFIELLRQHLKAGMEQLQEQYIHDLLEAYKEAGISHDTAIIRIQEKLPDMSKEDIVRIASEVI